MTDKAEDILVTLARALEDERYGELEETILEAGREIERLRSDIEAIKGLIEIQKVEKERIKKDE